MPDHSTQYNRRRQGFTLADLAITMLILGVLAAVAAPKFAASLVHFRVDAAAKRVAADLRYARQQAKTAGTSQAVTFTTATDTYVLPGLQDIYRPSQSFTVDLTATNYPASLLSVSLGAGGMGSTVVFDMYGRPDYGGSVVVQSGSEQRTIAIDAISGQVAVLP